MYVRMYVCMYFDLLKVMIKKKRKVKKKGWMNGWIFFLYIWLTIGSDTFDAESSLCCNGFGVTRIGICFYPNHFSLG